MRTKLLTLSACAVLITGCSTFGHQPEINAKGIDSIYVYTGMPKNNVESDIYQVLLKKTQKGLEEKGYQVLRETSKSDNADAKLVTRIEGVQNNYAVLGTYTKLRVHYELHDAQDKLIYKKTYSSDSLPNSQLDDWHIALATDLVASAYHKIKPPYEKLADNVTEALLEDFPSVQVKN